VSQPRGEAASQGAYRALQRRAREEGRGTQELFEFYLLERFLYRLSVSPHRGRFVLKGGLLLTAAGIRRPTRDADFLARSVRGDEESLLTVVREIVSIPAADGVAFDPSGARTTIIREHAAYPGVRIIVPATLGTARLQLRLDVNFGDPVDPQWIRYPTLLSDEAFELLGYPVETVIAEKVETMISRGDANTRERDYADVLMLSMEHTVEARTLRRELEKTAAHRATEIAPLAEILDTLPAARQGSWAAFVDRTGLTDALPSSFEEVVDRVAAFVDPVLRNEPGVERWDPAARVWR
jgi:hypothetical protein